jgi:aryl sulfotransferase
MSRSETRPKRYKTWTFDSARWDHYRPRDGDIIIATYPKCGTTWMQRIVDLLAFQSPEPRSVYEVSPWIDMRFGPPIDFVIDQIEAQSHRRFLKSHVPLDGLPSFEQVRYIHVARDGRDACMSFFNHCAAYTPFMYEALDRAAEDMGGPVPRCPSDVRTFWREWLTKGVAPGSIDGFPSLSFFDFERTYWRERQRKNLLLVHYNDLKADLADEMRRIADFLSIAVDPDRWPDLVEAATFEGMKRQGAALLPHVGFVFEGGTDRFLFKGTNGRWREEIPAEDLALYDAIAARRFTPGLARWIEGGRREAGEPRRAPE